MTSGSDTVPRDAPKDETATPTASAKFLVGTPTALLATLLVTLLLFLPILHYTFSPSDDASNILKNPYIADPSSQNLGYFFLHPFYYVYMPMTFCLWGLCARIAPLAIPQEIPLEHTVSYLNPLVFHAANLILHLANVALVFAILRRLRFVPWACAAGALVFALHPVQAEAVAWVTGANNLTAGFFSLLTLYLYMTGLSDNPDAPETARARRSVFFALATVSFACALLSKPAAAALPLSIAVIETLIYRRPWRRWIALMSFWCVLSCACALVAGSATSVNSSTVWSPLWGRVFVAGDALAFYLVRLVAPLATINYARPPSDVLHAWWGYTDWLFPAIVLGFLWCWPLRRPALSAHVSEGKQTPWIRVSVLLLLTPLISTLGLVPFYSQWYSTVADRYLYTPMLGPAVLAAFLVSLPTLALNGRTIMAMATILLLGFLTSAQIPVWSNTFTIVEYMAVTANGSPFVHMIAGNVFYYRGDYAHALPEFELGQKMLGTESVANNRSIVDTLVHLGRYDEAIKPIANIVLAHPEDQDAWLQLWSLLPHVHDTARLEAIMRQHLGQNPRDARAAFTLGAIFLYRRATPEALPLLATGVQGSPEFGGMHYDYGVMLEGMNRLPEAEAQYEAALAINPKNTQAAAALNLLRSRMGPPAHP